MPRRQRSRRWRQTRLTLPRVSFTTVSGTQFGVDFNPVADRLRSLAIPTRTCAVNVDNGLVQLDVPLAYQSGDPNFGDNPFVVAVAYSNNFPGATTTMLRGVDLGQDPDLLVVHTNPNGGTLQTSLGLPFNANNVSYDISRAGAAYFATTASGESNSRFWEGGAGGVTGRINRGGAVITSVAAATTLRPGELIFRNSACVGWRSDRRFRDFTIP